MISDQYAAGFIDGEASITFDVKTGGIRLDIAQVDRDVLVALATRYGGNVRMRSDGIVAVGRRQPGVRRRIWIWTLLSWEAADALITTLPHLIVKRRDAVEVLTQWVEYQRQRKKLQMPRSFYRDQEEPNLWRLPVSERAPERARRKALLEHKLADVEAAIEDLTTHHRSDTLVA